MSIRESIKLSELKAMADYISEEPVFRRLTEDETEILKNSISECQIFLRERDMAVAHLRDSMKMSSDEGVKASIETIEKMQFGELGTKELKATTAECVEQLKSGHKEIIEKVYGVAYHDDRVMVFYDSEGNYLYQRPLTTDEKASPGIFNLSKTGTEDGK